MEKYSFHKYMYFLAFYFILFFILGGGGGGGQITASFTCGQRYSMAILYTSHLYPLPPPATRIGGDNDFSKPCPVPVPGDKLMLTTLLLVPPYTTKR